MNIIRMIYPRKCPVCKKILAQDTRQSFCPECYRRLPWVEEPTCKHCGKPLASTGQEYCMDCEGKDSILHQGYALWVYNACTRTMMQAYKYGGHKYMADVYGRELYRHLKEKFSDGFADVIIPVPLHRRRRWFRGYNQAEEMAAALSSLSHVPCMGDVLLRKKYTKPQSGLDDRRRRRNVKDVFSLHPALDDGCLRGKNILLIDDIYTTGATLEECGKVLRNAGAGRIYFACLCIGQDM